MLEAVYCNFLLTIQGSVSSSDLYPISYCICPDFFYLLGKNCWPESSISTISMIFGINLHLGFVLTHQSSINAFYLWRENQFLPSKFIHIYIVFIWFFVVELGLYCGTQAFHWLQWTEDTLHFSTWVCHRGGVSCCREQVLSTRASVVAAGGLSSVVHRLRCSRACRIF